MAPDEDYCRCHSRHVAELQQCQKACDVNTDDHKDLWDEMKNKTSNTFFILLVGLFVSSLGFQWKNYEQIQRIATDVAVIKTEMRLSSGARDEINR